MAFKPAALEKLKPGVSPTLAWGAMVLLLFTACVATGLAGMIIIFPLLGHATWHAYRAVAPTEIWA
jgi:uncharacterized membrane protein